MAFCLMVPSHYLNQWWFTVNCKLGSNPQWHLNQNIKIFIQEYAFENGICTIMVIWFWPQCVDIAVQFLALKNSKHVTTHLDASKTITMLNLIWMKPISSQWPNINKATRPRKLLLCRTPDTKQAQLWFSQIGVREQYRASQMWNVHVFW